MEKSDRTLVLFTRWFPYNKWDEISFLEEELNHLNSNFKKVVIVPQRIEGELFNLPMGIELDCSMAEELNAIGWGDKLHVLFSLVFIKELFEIKFNRKKIKYAIANLLASRITQHWIKRFLADNENVILYSFWFDFTALGSVIAKKKYPSLRTAARCHNFDLYGNEENNFYVPFQKLIVSHLDGLYPDSFEGEKFIFSKFKNSNCKAAIMGVPKAKKVNLPSTDNVFRVMSCSHMIPRKRVPLIVEGLIDLAMKNPQLLIEWYHIGDGEEFVKVNEIIQNKPSNLKVDLKGRLNNIELETFYLENNIDLFINASTKEGTPVSLMESISYSIPVMATDFGGNKEIVEKGGGILLSKNPDINEISSKILSGIKSGKLKDIRNDCLYVWEQYYNCEKNYIEFCDRLRKL